MEWIARQPGTVGRLGILPGSFNPPTRAHIALAESALSVVDQVLLVLPRVFPHKQYDSATADERAEMLRRVVRDRPRLAAAFSEKGLFIDIVREARERYQDAEVSVICGRDAAERIITWDYGAPGAIENMLREFHLLVAPRQGFYTPPPHLAHAVHTLSADSWDHCSSTIIRESAEGWRMLVPDEIVEIVERIYPSRRQCGTVPSSL